MVNGPTSCLELARDVSDASGRRSEAAIDILAGPDAMAEVAHAWSDLEQDGGAHTAFQSYSMASACVAAHMRRQATPRIVVLRDKGQPRVIVPTVVTQLLGFSIIRFLGDPLIQYGDVLACSDVRHDEITTALAAAADPNVACLALFRRVRDDARVATALAGLGREVACESSPLVNLTSPSVLTARNAREQRRLRRRLAQCGELRVKVARGSDARPWLAEALRLKREWIAARGSASVVIGSPVWEQALHEIADAKASQLVAAVLTCGTKLAAIEIAFVNNHSWFGFIGAFAPEFAAHSPGLILGDECVQWARDNALQTFDQLPPAQHYKRRHATHLVAARDYAVPLTAISKLPLTVLKIIPSVKWVLAELPEDLRVAVLKASG